MRIDRFSKSVVSLSCWLAGNPTFLVKGPLQAGRHRLLVFFPTSRRRRPPAKRAASHSNKQCFLSGFLVCSQSGEQSWEDVEKVARILFVFWLLNNSKYTNMAIFAFFSRLGQVRTSKITSFSN
jgi:hypothetical protein